MPLDITIPSATTTSPSTGKAYTSYTISIKGALRTSTSQKRYSDFEALHHALISTTGEAPPAPLPPKSWIKSTLNNPSLTEERRQGLERYVREIENADDSRWRNSRAWRDFLGVGATSSTATDGGSNATFGSVRGVGGIGGQIVSAAGWLDAHAQLKTQLHEARTALNRRERASEVATQHEAGAGAKKSLVRAATLIAQLEDGLRRLSGQSKSSGGEDGWGGNTLGEGEIRRRRDLLSAARKEREGLEGVLNTLAVKSTLAGAMEKSLESKQATEGAKTGLFGGGAAGVGRGGRVLGGPAKETERTRELDNEGVLQLQQQVMKEQDMDVDDLAKVVRRMREMGVEINQELEEQSTMLDLVDQDVDRVQSKVDIAKKRIGKIK
ncbi:Phox-like protein [Rhizodiscina lignyota]|uniref:Phox-like protein n=1 Tax=Rhizodiscina lignyota TaxID=1504668 RepID=A0A9P4IMA1_9PEZI|nr:Phox-like protein [Rhizodiscina lignyota]